MSQLSYHQNELIASKSRLVKRRHKAPQMMIKNGHHQAQNDMYINNNRSRHRGRLNATPTSTRHPMPSKIQPAGNTLLEGGGNSRLSLSQMARQRRKNKRMTSIVSRHSTFSSATTRLKMTTKRKNRYRFYPLRRFLKWLTFNESRLSSNCFCQLLDRILEASAISHHNQKSYYLHHNHKKIKSSVDQSHHHNHNSVIVSSQPTTTTTTTPTSNNRKPTNTTTNSTTISANNNIVIVCENNDNNILATSANNQNDLHQHAMPPAIITTSTHGDDDASPTLRIQSNVELATYFSSSSSCSCSSSLSSASSLSSYQIDNNNDTDRCTTQQMPTNVSPMKVSANLLMVDRDDIIIINNKSTTVDNNVKQQQSINTADTSDINDDGEENDGDHYLSSSASLSINDNNKELPMSCDQQQQQQVTSSSPSSSSRDQQATSFTYLSECNNWSDVIAYHKVCLTVRH